MGSGFRLFKKRRRKHSTSDCDFYEVEGKFEGPQYEEFKELFRDYWHTVSPDDEEQYVIVAAYGSKGWIPKIEATLAWYWGTGFKIQAVAIHGLMVGFLIYQIPFDGVLLIRGLYVAPDFEKRGLGKGLVNSLEKQVVTVLFQTRTKYPPSRLLSMVQRRVKWIAKNDKSDLVTWQMAWRG